MARVSKAKLPAFRFKKHKRPTGLSAVGNPNPFVDVLIGRKTVGLIVPASWSNSHWSVQFMSLGHGHENCEWGWVSFKAKFPSEEDARQWIKRNAEYIHRHISLRYQDAEEDE